jgi:hypothetical protein
VANLLANLRRMSGPELKKLQSEMGGVLGSGRKEELAEKAGALFGARQVVGPSNTIPSESSGALANAPKIADIKERAERMADDLAKLPESTLISLAASFDISRLGSRKSIIEAIKQRLIEKGGQTDGGMHAGGTGTEEARGGGEVSIGKPEGESPQGDEGIQGGGTALGEQGGAESREQEAGDRHRAEAVGAEQPVTQPSIILPPPVEPSVRAEENPAGPAIPAPIESRPVQHPALAAAPNVPHGVVAKTVTPAKIGGMSLPPPSAGNLGGELESAAAMLPQLKERAVKLYEGAARNENTRPEAEALGISLAGLSGSDVAEIAKSIGFVQKFTSKEKAVKAIVARIIDRRGAYARAQESSLPMTPPVSGFPPLEAALNAIRKKMGYVGERIRYESFPPGVDRQLWRQCRAVCPITLPDELPADIGEVDGNRVCIVDGNKVKTDPDTEEDEDHPHMDFVEGANDLEARWVRREYGEKYLLFDGRLDIRDLPFVIYHEAYERRLMAGVEAGEGMTYDDAHEHANPQELALRKMRRDKYDAGKAAAKVDTEGHLHT